jgi:hypothetical protein
MKKLHSIVFASFAGALFVLTGCASYSMVQTPTMKDRPPSCEDLHIHYAEWNYKDTFGNDYHTVGRCVKGMMHGEFSYMMNGNLIARTKYTRNAEVKTVCLVGKKHASLLSYCLNEAVQTQGRHPDAQSPSQVPQSAAPAGQQANGAVMMVPAQPGQEGAVLMVPAKQGSDGAVQMVPAQPGQEGAVWMAPAPQGTTP